jgi:CheY-like chemotaxis protein
MKILMVDCDSNNRLLALFAFKDLNVANSMDFVGNDNELVQYFHTRLESNSKLPDLVLIDSNLKKSDEFDPIERIRSNPKLEHLNTIAFSIVSSANGSSPDSKEKDDFAGSDYQDELEWVLGEICDVLTTKSGWEYQIKPSSDNSFAPGGQLKL